MFQGIRKKTIVNFTIFILGLIILALLCSGYLNFFQNDRYNANIVDTIAEETGAKAGSLNKNYKGLSGTSAVFNAKSIHFLPEYEFTDFNGKEKKVKNAVILVNGVSYPTVQKFLANGGHFSLLNKKGKEIMAKTETYIEYANDTTTKMVFVLSTDEEPYYLLTHGIKINTDNANKRVFNIKRAKVSEE